MTGDEGSVIAELVQDAIAYAEERIDGARLRSAVLVLSVEDALGSDFVVTQSWPGAS